MSNKDMLAYKENRKTNIKFIAMMYLQIYTVMISMLLIISVIACYNDKFVGAIFFLLDFLLCISLLKSLNPFIKELDILSEEIKDLGGDYGKIGERNKPVE